MEIESSVSAFEEPVYLFAVEFGYRVALYFLLGRKLAADSKGLGSKAKRKTRSKLLKPFFALRALDLVIDKVEHLRLLEEPLVVDDGHGVLLGPGDDSVAVGYDQRGQVLLVLPDDYRLGNVLALGELLSMGAGSTFSPPRRTMVSLARPVILSSPLRVSMPRSPESSQPSSPRTLAVARASCSSRASRMVRGP